MSDVDTVVQSYIRTLARRGWCRQLPLVGQLDCDRAAGNVSPAVTCVACRLGGARNGAGRDACFVRGSGRGGIGDLGANGSVSDNCWLTRGLIWVADETFRDRRPHQNLPNRLGSKLTLARFPRGSRPGSSF
jgi:hypothetical protein